MIEREILIRVRQREFNDTTGYKVQFYDMDRNIQIDTVISDLETQGALRSKGDHPEEAEQIQVHRDRLNYVVRQRLSMLIDEVAVREGNLLRLLDEVDDSRRLRAGEMGDLVDFLLGRPAADGIELGIDKHSDGSRTYRMRRGDMVLLYDAEPDAPASRLVEWKNWARRTLEQAKLTGL